jgi:hypothetical protein
MAESVVHPRVRPIIQIASPPQRARSRTHGETVATGAIVSECAHDQIRAHRSNFQHAFGCVAQDLAAGSEHDQFGPNILSSTRMGIFYVESSVGMVAAQTMHSWWIASRKGLLKRLIESIIQRGFYFGVSRVVSRDKGRRGRPFVFRRSARLGVHPITSVHVRAFHSRCFGAIVHPRGSALPIGWGLHQDFACRVFGPNHLCDIADHDLEGPIQALQYPYCADQGHHKSRQSADDAYRDIGNLVLQRVWNSPACTPTWLWIRSQCLLKVLPEAALGRISCRQMAHKSSRF